MHNYQPELSDIPVTPGQAYGVGYIVSFEIKQVLLQAPITNSVKPLTSLAHANTAFPTRIHNV